MLDNIETIYNCFLLIVETSAENVAPFSINHIKIIAKSFDVIDGQWSLIQSKYIMLYLNVRLVNK